MVTMVLVVGRKKNTQKEVKTT